MALAVAMAHAAVEMSIVTNKGYVAFVVGDDWAVLSMQSKLPIATASFQVPNPADQGTPDSTNLAIVLYDSESKEARSNFEAPVTIKGSAPQQATRYQEWTVWRQEAVQGSTRYTILDAKREGLVDVLVKVRLAWPHLGTNASGYDAEMESTFHSFLTSVRGAKGKYEPGLGVTFRRREP